MEIKPQYVSFEIAKTLKIKDFNVECNLHWEWGNGDKKLNRPPSLFIGGFLGENDLPRSYKNSELMNSYTDDEGDVFGEFSAPEIWQVIEWLKLKHDIWLSVDRFLLADKSTIKWIPKYYLIADRSGSIIQPSSHYMSEENRFDSPQEAYLSAINYIVSKLI